MAKRRKRTLTVTGSATPLSEADLQALESRLAFPLPNEYRQFLLAHNGGRLNPAEFHFKNQTGPYTDSCVDSFYAVYDGDHNNFEKIYLFCKAEGLFPPHIIPIADDPGGNIICLSVSGPDMNSVYFWDHEGIDEYGKQANLHLIADSFSEFLLGLEETSEYVEPEFDRLLRENDIDGLRVLIASGWDVNKFHEGRQQIPVETAAIYGQTEFIQVLLDHGAKAGGALDMAERGMNIPHLAGLYDYEGVVRILKNHVHCSG